MKVAVVGATGLVGTRMLDLLEEMHFPVDELLPVASEKSVGRKVVFGGREWTVMSADDAIAARPQLALFSAGGGTSSELAPKFAAAGCRVVDNSSFWRMDPTKKLVVPEINGADALENKGLIANPNCCTIIALMAVAAWLGEVGKNNKMFFIPMAFMLAATLTFLAMKVVSIVKLIAGLVPDKAAAWGDWFQLVFAAAMFVLAIILIVQGVKTFSAQAKAKKK